MEEKLTFIRGTFGDKGGVGRDVREVNTFGYFYLIYEKLVDRLNRLFIYVLFLYLYVLLVFS